MANIKQKLDTLSDRANNGQKIWRARKLMNIVPMGDWKQFREYVFKGIKACEAAGYNSMEHFIETNAIMVKDGYDDDYWLSAYGCNLVCDCIPDLKFKGEFIHYFTSEIAMKEAKADHIERMQCAATNPVPPLSMNVREGYPYPREESNKEARRVSILTEEEKRDRESIRRKMILEKKTRPWYHILSKMGYIKYIK